MSTPSSLEDFSQRVLQSRLELFEARLRVQQRLDDTFVHPFVPDSVLDDSSADTSRPAPSQIPMSQVALALRLNPDLELPSLPLSQTTIDQFAFRILETLCTNSEHVSRG